MLKNICKKLTKYKQFDEDHNDFYFNTYDDYCLIHNANNDEQENIIKKANTYRKEIESIIFTHSAGEEKYTLDRDFSHIEQETNIEQEDKVMHEIQDLVKPLVTEDTIDTLPFLQNYVVISQLIMCSNKNVIVNFVCGALVLIVSFYMCSLEKNSVIKYWLIANNLFYLIVLTTSCLILIFKINHLHINHLYINPCHELNLKKIISIFQNLTIVGLFIVGIFILTTDAFSTYYYENDNTNNNNSKNNAGTNYYAMIIFSLDLCVVFALLFDCICYRQNQKLVIEKKNSTGKKKNKSQVPKFYKVFRINKKMKKCNYIEITEQTDTQLVNELYELFKHDKIKTTYLNSEYIGYIAIYYYRKKTYDKMKLWSLFAYDLGNYYAINKLGEYYQYIEKNYVEMDKCYKLCIYNKCTESMLNYADFFKKNHQYSMAKEMYLLAIDEKNVEAMMIMAMWYRSIEKNNDLCVFYYTKAIEHKSIDAMIELALFYRRSNFYLLKKFLKMAIDNDSVRAVLLLASYYEKYEKKYHKMIKWYEFALGRYHSSDACVHLAKYYSTIEPNDKLMLKYYEYAFGFGNYSVALDLGMYYRYTKKDYKKMKKYCRIASSFGINSVSAFLADYYQTIGKYHKMKKYYLEAMERNYFDPKMMYNFGKYYELIAKDYDKMKICYSVAILQNYEKARESMAKYNDPIEIKVI
jgi:heme/copper-type cytochrome/quinol oxidase subunit 3